MANQIEVGARLHARYSGDGRFYYAEVTGASDSRRRASAPILVNFIGYGEEEWKAISDLRCKWLTTNSEVPAQRKKTKAQAQSNKQDRDQHPVPPGPGGLCIAGESLIDMLPRETTEGQSAFLPKPGGAPVNALIAACRLSIPVTYLASLSIDMFGEDLYAVLSREGVRLNLVHRLDRPTTLAFVSRQPGKGEQYAFFKENAADRALTKQRVREVFKSHRFDAVHMSLGAITLEDVAMAKAFHELFHAAGRQSALRTFDPNLRSNMIRGGATSYRKRIEALLGSLDVIKSSDDDIYFLYGQHAVLREVATRWLEFGPKLVVITKGADGAVAYPKGSSEIAVAPPGARPKTIDAEGKPAEVLDTVGAGDTFMGALIQGFNGTCKYEFSSEAPLLAQLVKGKAWDKESLTHLRNVLERAAVAAAINCSRAGCDPPTSAEVNAAGKALGLAFVLE